MSDEHVTGPMHRPTRNQEGVRELSEERMAVSDATAAMHSDRWPLLGRKIAGKAQFEVRDRGLVVEPADAITLNGTAPA